MPITNYNILLLMSLLCPIACMAGLNVMDGLRMLRAMPLTGADWRSGKGVGVQIMTVDVSGNSMTVSTLCLWLGYGSWVGEYVRVVTKFLLTT